MQFSIARIACTTVTSLDTQLNVFDRSSGQSIIGATEKPRLEWFGLDIQSRALIPADGQLSRPPVPRYHAGILQAQHPH
jgi:hypothetical protein